MRVLWFSVTPSLYGANNVLHNGGGWIAALEALLGDDPDIELGVAFEHPDTCGRTQRGRTTYYPMPILPGRKGKWIRKFRFEQEDRTILEHCLRVVDDFRPEVIHVFGSEWAFGLVSAHVKVPVVIHLQGSIPPYNNAAFPPGFSFLDSLLANRWRLPRTFEDIRRHFHGLHREARELEILASCKNFMGRTHWDRSLVELLSPGSRYFYCSEVLREPFHQAEGRWRPQARERKILASVVSGGLLKGHDLILKTAALLRRHGHFPFEWRIFGTRDLNRVERKLGIRAEDVGVKLMGTASAEVLRDSLLETDLFIHPSYIDNSPNSVCEAQLLGMPILATNVGGVASLVQHEETGLLVPANDPFQTACQIQRLLDSPQSAAALGSRAAETARHRHHRATIRQDLLQTYRSILSASKGSP